LNGYQISALAHGQTETVARSDSSDPSGTYGFEAAFRCDDGTTRTVDGSERQAITDCAPAIGRTT